MKIRVFLVMCALTMMSLSASAQMFRLGATAGASINKVAGLHYVEPKAKAAFTGGVTFEVNAPILGLGFDISMLYERRRVVYDVDPLHLHPLLASSDPTVTDSPDFYAKVPRSRSFINIPLNVKWKFGLPVLGNFLTPFVATGPQIGFLVGHREDYDHKRVWSWNAGVGVEILHKVQIKANYAIPLSTSIAVACDRPYYAKYKDHDWTLTATWFF